MSFNINDFKKKLIYRSEYRGKKEMDILISAFVKKNINIFNESELKDLSELLDVDDENLQKWCLNLKTTIPIKKNRVSILLKNFKLNK